MSFELRLQWSFLCDTKMPPLARPYKSWTIPLEMGNSKERRGET